MDKAPFDTDNSKPNAIEAKAGRKPSGWAETEFEATVLGDVRRNKQAIRLIERLSTQASAAFVAAMEQVPDIYSRPCDAAHPLVCVDETPCQRIGETRQPIAVTPGRPERHAWKYQRWGVCNVFMASEPLAGRRLTKVTEHRTKIDWALFMQDIAAN